jgi:hypothetical protein
MPFQPPVPTFPWPDYLDAPDEPAGIILDNPDTRAGATLYRWATRGWNCPICQIMSNRIYRLDYWQNTVMPGFHPHCDCSLVPQMEGAVESDHDLFNPDFWWWNPITDSWEKIFQHRWNWLAGMAEDMARAYEKTDDAAAAWRLLEPKISIGGIGIGNPQNAILQGHLSFETLAGTWIGNVETLLNNCPIPKADLPWECPGGFPPVKKK